LINYIYDEGLADKDFL